MDSFKFILALGVIYIGFRFLSSWVEEQNRKNRERIAAEKASADAKAAHRQRQIQLADLATSDRERGAMAFVRMPEELLAAEAHIDRAEEEFEERAFSPFWEQVESALQSLSKVETLANQISYAAEQHDEHVRDLDTKQVVFPVSTKDIEVIRNTARSTRERLAQVIRRSTKDFEFSTIYEQRKTNSILIHGFRTLGEAVSGLGDKLASSIDALGDRIADLEMGMQSRHDEAQEMGKRLIGATESMRASNEAAATAAAEQRERIAGAQSIVANRQLAMLDNLQRKRRPTMTEKGPRSF